MGATQEEARSYLRACKLHIVSKLLADSVLWSSPGRMRAMDSLSPSQPRDTANDETDS